VAKILIVGGGFAAIAAAEILADGVGDKDEIIVVAENDKFIFYPGLLPLVFDKCKLNDVYFDLSQLLQQRKIKFIKAEVIGIDPPKKTIRIVNGPDEEILNFDFLLVAAGRKPKIAAIPGFREYSNHLLSVEAALLFKQAIAAFESGSIVLGLCPDASLPIPLCEAALGLAERFRQKIKGGDISIKLLFPVTLEKALAGSGLFRDLETEFEEKGITLLSDFPVSVIYENSILAATGSCIHYDLLMLMPAFSGPGVLSNQSSITDREGFAQVDENMQIVGFDQIYAAGDIISLSGPRFGYMALRQGKVAAENILARLSDKEPEAVYRHDIEWIIGKRYTDPVFLHYGFWDETLADFNENALFGMAKLIRERYGSVKEPSDDVMFAGSI